MNRNYKGLEVRIKHICKIEGQYLYKMQIFDIDCNGCEYPKRLLSQTDRTKGTIEDVFENVAKPWIDLYKKEEKK